MDAKKIQHLIGDIERSIKGPQSEPKPREFEPRVTVALRSDARRTSLLRRASGPIPSEPVPFENRCKRFGCRLAKVMYSKWCDAHSEEEGV